MYIANKFLPIPGLKYLAAPLLCGLFNLAYAANELTVHGGNPLLVINDGNDQFLAANNTDFGETELNNTKTLSYQVTNNTNTPISLFLDKVNVSNQAFNQPSGLFALLNLVNPINDSWAAVNLPYLDFTLAPTDLDLLAGETKIFSINFTPTDLGDRKAEIQLSQKPDPNDPSNILLLYNFQVIGKGINSNQIPIANDANSYIRSLAEDTSLTILSSDLKNRYTDPDGDTLTISSVTANTGGSVSLSNDQLNINFIPIPNFTGQAKFTYTVSDGKGGMVTGEVIIDITVINDRPTLKQAPNNTQTTPEDTPLEISVAQLIGNFEDIEGDTLSLASLQNPSNGTVQFNSDRSKVMFIPSLNFNGIASFSYTVNDGNTDGSISDSFTIHVQAINDEPIIKTVLNNTAETLEETSISIPVQQLVNNFTDPDGDTIELVSVASILGGSVKIEGENVIFTPAKDFTYTAIFQYTVKDSVSSSSSNTVDNFTIKVKNVNDPPELKPAAQVNNTSTLKLSEDLRITKADLFNNFTDPDSTQFTYKFSNIRNGKILDETLTYIIFVADAGFAGDASFDYTLLDNEGASATDTFKIKVIKGSSVISIDSNGQTIDANDQTPSNTNGTDWGQGTIGQPINHTYRIGNASDEDLKIIKIDIIEPDPDVVIEFDIYKLLGIETLFAAGVSDFSLQTQLPITVPSNGSANFTLQFNPSAVGLRTADVLLTFSNNDTYKFRIAGTGIVHTEIPMFSPFGLLALLFGLIWLGRRYSQ